MDPSLPTSSNTSKSTFPTNKSLKQGKRWHSSLTHYKSFDVHLQMNRDEEEIQSEVAALKAGSRHPCWKSQDRPNISLSSHTGAGNQILFFSQPQLSFFFTYFCLRARCV